MRVLCAPDSFKESLSAIQFCDIAREALAADDIDVNGIPLGDGGEGSRDALLASESWDARSCRVATPTRGHVDAAYAVNQSSNTAFIEMAAASGLGLVPADERDPMNLDTRGTGELIADALENGFETIVVGVGGSATCDGGAGALAALGVRFLDANAAVLFPAPAALAAVEKIDLSELHPAIASTHFVVASDVTNPLLGERGAAHVFGPQKGASEESIPKLEAVLAKLADAYRDASGIDISTTPGAGAAGGLAAALATVCRAEILSGFAWIADAVGLDSALVASDWVLTGEGRVDDQTFSGKTVSGICERALRHDKPVAIIAGDVDCPEHVLKDAGVQTWYSLSDFAGGKAAALSDPQRFLRAALLEFAKAIRDP